MRLFRSEEDIDDPRGALLSTDACWRLASAWYGALQPRFERFSTERAQRILTSVGLTGEFWQL
jgi:hypothetical protein